MNVTLKKVKTSICIARQHVYKTPLTCISSLKLSHRAVFRSPHTAPACKHSPAQWPNNQPQAAPAS